MSLFKRFPSIHDLVKGASDNFKRFPMMLLCAVTGTVAAILLSEADYPEHEYNLIRLLMTCGLGLPLFMALTTLTEQRRWKLWIAFGAQLLGVVLLVLHFISLPGSSELRPDSLLRFAILFAAALTAVAWLPFVGKNRVADFWEYNKTLFLRFALTALYAAVLYIGASLAIVTADQLFDLDINDRRYFQFWFIMVGVFMPWFFLGGVPRNYQGLTEGKSYPLGLKVLVQYILLPLVVVYFVILFTYEIKILVTWDWPKGWASLPVLWFAVGGIFTLLFLYPLREANLWVRHFFNWFFRCLLPLLVLLWLAIGMRISDYGITENRYLVVAMGVGLTLVGLYFVFSRGKDIRIVPITITVLALVASMGPWGAFDVSQCSQQERLEQMLVQNELWHEGSFSGQSVEVPFDKRKDMSAVIDYLVEWHGRQSFTRWIDAPAFQEAGIDTTGSPENTIASYMGFEHVMSWATEDRDVQLVGVERRNSRMVSGFDMVIEHRSDRQAEYETPMTYVGDEYLCTATLTDDPYLLEFVVGSSGDFDTISFPLGMEAARLYREYSESTVPPEKATFDLTGDRYRVRLELESVFGRYARDDKPSEIESVRCWLLVGKTSGR